MEVAERVECAGMSRRCVCVKNEKLSKREREELKRLLAEKPGVSEGRE